MELQQFESVYKMYHLQLYNAIFRLTKNDALTKDIVQNTFLKALQTNHPLKEEKAAFNWLLKIAKNELHDYHRNQVKHISYLNDSATELTTANISGDDKTAELAAAHLRQKLTELPILYQQAVLKADVEDIPQSLLAVKENISVSAIKSRVQRGRKELKKVFEKECDIDIDSYGNINDCTSKIPNCSCR